jgi:hypothetical protein
MTKNKLHVSLQNSYILPHGFKYAIQIIDIMSIFPVKFNHLLFDNNIMKYNCPTPQTYFVVSFVDKTTLLFKSYSGKNDVTILHK